MKYVCDDCGQLFSEPDSVLFETGVRSEGVDEIIEHQACPYCSSSQFTKAPKCDICGEYNAQHENTTVCEDCYQDMKGLIAIAFNNFQTMHKEATEDDMYYLLYELWNEFDEGR
jgi:DNA-directed RNA polymerase subunit RPC12/RpoP